MRTENEFIHDLATPLSTAYSLMELITEEVKEEGQAESPRGIQLSRTLKALDRILALIDDRRLELQRLKGT